MGKSLKYIKQGCGHKTVACCQDCRLCFACCVCERIAKVVFGIAARVRKRDEWFIGGYLGHVEAEWREYREKGRAGGWRQ